MKNILARIYGKLLYINNKFILRDPVVRGVDVWYAVSPKGNLLFEHRLPPKPVVFDIGGFTGEATQGILERYPDAVIHVFEPLPQYVAVLEKKFAKAKGVQVHPYGVGAATEDVVIHEHGEGSSAFRVGGRERRVEIRGIVEVMRELSPKGVDLMMINAEGAEYGLLDALLGANLAEKVGTLVIQFHTVVENSRARKAVLARKLSATHELVFDIPFVWEKWVKKAK